MSDIKLYLRPKYREEIDFRRKLTVISLVVATGFALLILRLAYLQLVAGSEFKGLSDKNRIRLIRLIAARGLAYDRHGELLIDNRPSFTVSLIPAEAPDPSTVLEKLHGFIEFDETVVSERLHASRRAPYRQIVIARDISVEQAGAIEEYSLELPGIVITAQPCRRFPLAQTACQLLGYPGEISSGELEELAEQGYLIGDYIGKMGIELVAEEWLRGEDGGMQVQVHADARPQVELDATGNPRVRIDTAGRELFMLGEKPPRAGNIIRLTLDAQIQRIAEEELGDHVGAIVVMASDTGAIRALASKPLFDPNAFVTAGSSQERIEVLNGPGHPLLNRALQAYPPGSTFKIITAYAALNEGLITQSTRITCTGSFKRGRKFRCWRDAGHGSLKLVEALAYSCDVFFYKIGLELGIERIAKYARIFGMGGRVGVDLQGEMSGLVPSREWKAKVFRSISDKRWYDGETLNVSIGQGFLLATPLQLARAYAAIVNGGRLMQPYLIEVVEPPDGGPDLFRRGPLEEQSLSNQAALENIEEGLRQAVYSTTPFYGTGWRAKNKLVPLIGKTGTAQVAGFKERADTKEKLKKIPYKKRDHAWFVALMEEGEEPLVIVALCEHGGHASESAVPAAREVAKRIYNLMQKRTGNPKEEETNS